MTPVSIGLSILGLIALFWPLATLLCKRYVLNAQWFMMLALTLIALSFFLLGTLFNTFLAGEYLLLLLFLLVIIINPPVIYVAITVLTQQKPSHLSLRFLFIPSLLTIALIILSILVAGPDTYRLWAARGLDGLSGTLFPNSWRYNLIVISNFYLFWTVFSFETIYIFVGGIRKYFRLKRSNSEYYTADRFHNLNLKGLYIAANLGLFIMTLSQFTNPFHPDNTHLFFFSYCLPLAIILFYVGHSVYRINNGAERLPRHSRTRRDPSALAPILLDYVEKQRAFLNPNLSVFLLAEHFHTSEDHIIDAIHLAQGTPFGDYIDTLRVQYAAIIIANQQLDTSDPNTLSFIAHQSGFLTTNAFYNAWKRFIQVPLDQLVNV